MRAAALLLAVSLGGCALMPVEQSPALDEARTLYRQAAADPQVQRRAPMDLAAAERALGQAERSWRDKKSPDLVTHQAYLAAQRARLALANAEYRVAEARIATSRDTRSRLLIEARERDATEARSRADAELARATTEKRAAQPAEPPKAPRVDPAAEQSQLAGLKARQTERGWVVTLPNDVLFEGGRAALKPGAEHALEDLARFLREHPERDIAIEGFTDASGSTDSNRRLSESRALAVKDTLVARGIQERRIDARGYGPSFPVASNETPDGRQANRRVEIIINPS